MNKNYSKILILTSVFAILIPVSATLLIVLGKRNNNKTGFVVDYSHDDFKVKIEKDVYSTKFDFKTLHFFKLYNFDGSKFEEEVDFNIYFNFDYNPLIDNGDEEIYLKKYDIDMLSINEYFKISKKENEYSIYFDKKIEEILKNILKVDYIMIKNDTNDELDQFKIQIGNLKHGYINIYGLINIWNLELDNNLIIY